MADGPNKPNRPIRPRQGAPGRKRRGEIVHAAFPLAGECVPVEVVDPAFVNRAFGHYAHYVGWFLMWNLTSRGYAWQHLWPDAPAFNNDFLTVATGAGSCCRQVVVDELIVATGFRPEQ